MEMNVILSYRQVYLMSNISPTIRINPHTNYKLLNFQDIFFLFLFKKLSWKQTLEIHCVVWQLWY